MHSSKFKTKTHLSPADISSKKSDFDNGITDEYKRAAVTGEKGIEVLSFYLYIHPMFSL